MMTMLLLNSFFFAGRVELFNQFQNTNKRSNAFFHFKTHTQTIGTTISKSNTTVESPFVSKKKQNKTQQRSRTFAAAKKENKKKPGNPLTPKRKYYSIKSIDPFPFRLGVENYNDNDDVSVTQRFAGPVS